MHDPQNSETKAGPARCNDVLDLFFLLDGDCLPAVGPAECAAYTSPVATGRKFSDRDGIAPEAKLKDTVIVCAVVLG